MSRNILVVNGHPDPRPERFCAALCEAFSAGAQAKGCATRRLDVGTLNLPALDGIESAYRLFRAADRLAIFYPLWADAPPTELRQLFDYVSRLTAHLDPARTAAKVARVVVTTALPAFLYRTKQHDDAPRLSLAGVQAQEPTFIGSVESISDDQRVRWLAEMRGYGKSCA